MSSINAIGQIYEVSERTTVPLSVNVYCCGRYTIGSDDYYHYESYSPSQRMSIADFMSISKGSKHFFCYSKEAKRYFFYSDNIIGYYNPSDHSWEKIFLKNLKEKRVKRIGLEEFPLQVEGIQKQMDENYKKKNDSITERKRIQREQKKRDSVIAAQKRKAEMDEYRRTHNWRDLEMSKMYRLNCPFCGISHNKEKYFVISLSADTIYYLLEEPEVSMLGINHVRIHYSALTTEFKRDRQFEKYINTWEDSIANNNAFNNQKAIIFNIIQYNTFKEKVCKVAPDGFIKRWGWELNTADGIEPYFTFFNTSKKTIKYVDFYFSVFNAVGDKCYLKYNRSYVGYVRGVGPVEPFEAGSWNWDRATHYTSADASEMRVVKLVITYMDGSTKTIPRNAIVYE